MPTRLLTDNYKTKQIGHFFNIYNTPSHQDIRIFLIKEARTNENKNNDLIDKKTRRNRGKECNCFEGKLERG